MATRKGVLTARPALQVHSAQWRGLPPATCADHVPLELALPEVPELALAARLGRTKIRWDLLHALIVQEVLSVPRERQLEAMCASRVDLEGSLLSKVPRLATLAIVVRIRTNPEPSSVCNVLVVHSVRKLAQMMWTPARIAPRALAVQWELLDVRKVRIDPALH